MAKSFIKLFTFIAALAAFSDGALAQDQIKVIKAKGNKGIVQFPKGYSPKSGDTFNIGTGNESFGGDSAASAGGGGGGAGRRQYKLGLSLGAGKKATELGPNSLPGGTDFGFVLTARPGFNLDGTFELGPVLALTKIGDFGFAIGAFAELNFIKNTPGTQFVPGLGVQGTFAKGGTITADGSLFGKFFVLGTSTTCLRVDAGAALTKTDAGSTIGFGLGGGLEAYF